jgi:hypothetical protein
MHIVSKLEGKAHTHTCWWTGNKYVEWRAKKRLSTGTKTRQVVTHLLKIVYKISVDLKCNKV